MGEELAAPGAGRRRHGHARARVRASPPRRASPRASGIPYGDGLVKNRYVGRTFIQPNQQQRGHGRAAQAQPAAREHPRQAARRRRRLDRARHHDPPGRRRCSARPAPPRCTSGCRRRRTGGRASTAWTPAAVPSCSPPTCRSARSATTSASTRSPTSSSTASRAATGASRRLVLHRLPLGRLPGAGRPSSSTRSCARGRALDPDRSPAPRRRGVQRRRRPRDRTSRLTYATPGVDIAAGEKAVELIKAHVRSTFRPEVVGDIGGFGGLFALGASASQRPAPRVVDRRRRARSR